MEGARGQERDDGTSGPVGPLCALYEGPHVWRTHLRIWTTEQCTVPVPDERAFLVCVCARARERVCVCEYVCK